MRKKRKIDLNIIYIGIIFLIILVILLIFFLKPKPFLAPPNLPHHFYGSVRCLNGNPILAGHSLIGYTPIDANSTSSSIYPVPYPLYDYNLLIDHGADNEEIQFYIDTTDSGNYLANYIIVFFSGLR